MICLCGKEFIAKRKDAKYCSSKCRKQASRVTDNVVTDNVTDKVSVPPVSVPYKSPLACKVVSCKLEAFPGHNDMCIYHWRKENRMPTISKQAYSILNV